MHPPLFPLPLSPRGAGAALSPINGLKRETARPHTPVNGCSFCLVSRANWMDCAVEDDNESRWLSRISRERYIESLHVALLSWREVRLGWLRLLDAGHLPAEDQQRAREAFAQSEAEIARIEQLLTLYLPPAP
jgi:hypothetical protein